MPTLPPETVPVLVMPPAKVETDRVLRPDSRTTLPTWMPLGAPVIVPMLVIPPVKVETPLTKMPAMVPVLVTPPPNDDTLSTMVLGPPDVDALPTRTP